MTEENAVKLGEQLLEICEFVKKLCINFSDLL